MAAAGAGGGGLPVDDVFSTDLWKGNSTTQTITNGIDLSGEGGLVWIKGRNDTWAHALFDTERGPGYELDSTNNNAHDSDTQVNNQKDLYQFNSTGYSIGQNYNSYINRNGDTFVGWSFRKAPGFFDVIKYTGNGSTRNISHSLESIPGMIIIKAIGLTENWYVWHRDMQDANSSIRLNYESPEANNYNQGFGGPSAVLPTATHFTLGNGYSFNNNGSEYIAYVFAGGASSAATARSVDFDGSGDSLTVASSSDFAFGTGDFTIELWFQVTSNLTLKHTASIFVDYAISLSQKLKSYIFIQINKNNFHIAYINNSKLLFYNEFKYKSLDDFMYYFLNCLNVLELNHNLIDVKLMSSLESNDPVFTSIKNYLNNTHFINRPNNFNYSHNIHEISEHKYHDIFSQLICV